MRTNWTASEKKIARRIFEAALQHELAEVMSTFKSMAANASTPEDMWITEEFLTKSRREIDRKYDYRYSQLDFLFMRLLYEGRISEKDLAGLFESKLQAIIPERWKK